MLIATHSGLRGRPGIELTEAVVTRAVGGFVELLRRRGGAPRVAVARDERPAGRLLSADVIRVLLSSGTEVVDFGAVSTPTAKLAARLRGLGGLVVVTGSHLEPEWNGLKFVAAPEFAPIDVRTLPAPTWNPVTRGRLRAVVDAGAARDHAVAVCASVDAGVVGRARFRVACSGGAGASAAMVLERLGCRPPTPEAELGLRLDADGDRLQLLDERGAPLDEDATLALVVLARDAVNVVKGADTSRMVDDLVARRGGRVRIVPPGELHLVRALAEEGGDLAGEGNGGVVVPGVNLARDGLAAAASILELCARTGRTISELAARLPRYARQRSNVPCADPSAAHAALSAVAARLGAAQRDPDDGVHVERPDGAWGLVRISATEPVLRVTAEAPTAAAAGRLHAELRSALVMVAPPA